MQFALHLGGRESVLMIAHLNILSHETEGHSYSKDH